MESIFCCCLFWLYVYVVDIVVVAVRTTYKGKAAIKSIDFNSLEVDKRGPVLFIAHELSRKNYIANISMLISQCEGALNR